MTPLENAVDQELPRRVRHVMLGFEGTAVRTHTLEDLPLWPGLMVVWDEDVEIVGVEPGEEVWYPTLVLTPIPEPLDSISTRSFDREPTTGGWWRRAMDWLDRFAELRRPL